MRDALRVGYSAADVAVMDLIPVSDPAWFVTSSSLSVASELDAAHALVRVSPLVRELVWLDPQCCVSDANARRSA